MGSEPSAGSSEFGPVTVVPTRGRFRTLPDTNAVFQSLRHGPWRRDSGMVCVSRVQKLTGNPLLTRHEYGWGWVDARGGTAGGGGPAGLGGWLVPRRRPRRSWRDSSLAQQCRTGVVIPWRSAGAAGAALTTRTRCWPGRTPSTPQQQATNIADPIHQPADACSILVGRLFGDDRDGWMIGHDWGRPSLGWLPLSEPPRPCYARQARQREPSQPPRRRAVDMGESGLVVVPLGV